MTFFVLLQEKRRVMVTRKNIYNWMKCPLLRHCHYLMWKMQDEGDIVVTKNCEKLYLFYFLSFAFYVSLCVHFSPSINKARIVQYSVKLCGMFFACTMCVMSSVRKSYNGSMFQCLFFCLFSMSQFFTKKVKYVIIIFIRV